MNEIEEFYSYIEMPQIAENLRAWEGSFTSGRGYNTLLAFGDNPFAEWTKAPLSQRRTHVELLLESLEHRDAEIRFTNARRIFYVLQGIHGFAIHRYIYKAPHQKVLLRKLYPRNINCIGYSRTAKWCGLQTA
jgi:hypothetical protein